MRVGRMVDLSRPIVPGMQVYPGDPEPSFRQVATVCDDGFCLHEVVLGSQSGTHVDAPSHIVDGTASIDQVAVDRFAAFATIIDCRDVPPLGLVQAAQVRGLPVGHAVIIRVGWDIYDGTEQAWDHPGLSSRAAEELVAAGVPFVGIDAASIDRHGEAGLPAHQVLANAGVPIIENLAHLGAVDWPAPLIVVAPLSLVGLDGAPTRAVALEVLPG
ncbi:MAG: cyclase family protein [Actinomycetes bacterium]